MHTSSWLSIINKEQIWKGLHEVTYEPSQNSSWIQSAIIYTNPKEWTEKVIQVKGSPRMVHAIPRRIHDYLEWEKNGQDIPWDMQVPYWVYKTTQWEMTRKFIEMSTYLLCSSRIQSVGAWFQQFNTGNINSLYLSAIAIQKFGNKLTIWAI